MTICSLVTYLTVSGLLWGVFAGAAAAHSEGASLEQAVGEYVVDIGYEPAEVMAGERLVLDFNISKGGEGGDVAFDSVWVRIAGEETLLATGIVHADIGATTLLFVIPEDVSELTIGTRFEKDGEVLANTEFTLPVSAQKRSIPMLPAVAPVAGALALVATLFFLVFRFRNPHTKEMDG